MYKYSFNYFGSIVEAESLGINFVPNLSQTLSCHCVPFTDDGKVVAINIVGRGIDIPGGHIDEGETATEAIMRETYEEAHITLKNLQLIDVWLLSSVDNRLGLLEKPYLLLYVAEVQSIKIFISNSESDSRLLLDPDEFITKYFGDKRQAKNIIDKALRSLKQA